MIPLSTTLFLLTASHKICQITKGSKEVQNVPHSIENFLTQIVTVKALDSCEYSLVAVKKER